MSDSVILVVQFPVQENEPEEIPSDELVKYGEILARSIRDWISSLKREL